MSFQHVVCFLPGFAFNMYLCFGRRLNYNRHGVVSEQVKRTACWSWLFAHEAFDGTAWSGDQMIITALLRRADHSTSLGGRFPK